MKKTIKLTESDLHNMIAESVKIAINELFNTDKGKYTAGRVGARAYRRGDINTMHNAWSKATNYGRDENIYSKGEKDQEMYMKADSAARDNAQCPPNLKVRDCVYGGTTTSGELAKQYGEAANRFKDNIARRTAKFK